MSDEREMKVVGGVEVRKLTPDEESDILADSCGEWHTRKEHGFINPPCFPYISIHAKDIPGLLWISHFIDPFDDDEEVICMIILERFTTWKAPKHKAGKCPFMNYKKEK